MVAMKKKRLWKPLTDKMPFEDYYVETYNRHFNELKFEKELEKKARRRK